MHIQHSSFSVEIENVLEMLHLFLELDDKSIICCTHCIGGDFHHDLLRPICEFEGRDGLRDAITFRIACSDQSCLRVTTEGVLQESCDLGISVGDVILLFALRKCRDHLTKG